MGGKRVVMASQGPARKAKNATKAINLKTQRRLASEIYKVGVRKVWLDPEKKKVIKQAQTREQIRELMKQGLIQNRFDWGPQGFKIPFNPKYMTKFQQLNRCNIADSKRLRTRQKRLRNRKLRAQKATERSLVEKLKTAVAIQEQKVQKLESEIHQ